MNQVELSERSLKRFGFLLVDPETGMTVSEEEQLAFIESIRNIQPKTTPTSLKTTKLSKIIELADCKTILIQVSQGPKFKEEISERTLHLVKQIFKLSPGSDISIVKFDANGNGNMADHLTHSLVFTVFPGNVNIDKTRGLPGTEGSTLLVTE